MKKIKTRAEAKTRIIKEMLDKINLLKMNKKEVLERTGLSHNNYEKITAGDRRDIRHIRFDAIYKADQKLIHYYKNKMGNFYKSNDLLRVEKAINDFIYGGVFK